MANQHKDVLVSSSCHPLTVKLVVASFLLMVMLIISACSGQTPSVSILGTSTGSVAHTADAAAATYPIKVFFPKFPQSNSSLTAVFPVDRVSPTIGVATFAIQLLIAGPTTAERSAGYFSELNSLLSGASNCSAPFPTGGPDFTLVLNKKGNVTQVGTVTLRFCRSVSSPGIGADARVIAEISTTLKQFSNIKNVVILTTTGHCFGDESGMDHCLK